MYQELALAIVTSTQDNFLPTVQILNYRQPLLLTRYAPARFYLADCKSCRDCIWHHPLCYDSGSALSTKKKPYQLHPYHLASDKRSPTRTMNYLSNHFLDTY